MGSNCTSVKCLLTHMRNLLLLNVGALEQPSRMCVGADYHFFRSYRSPSPGVHIPNPTSLTEAVDRSPRKGLTLWRLECGFQIRRSELVRVDRSGWVFEYSFRSWHTGQLSVSPTHRTYSAWDLPSEPSVDPLSIRGRAGSLCTSGSSP
jgi:hypothetical protein